MSGSVTEANGSSGARAAEFSHPVSRMILSVVMPVYNEERTVAQAIDGVLSTSYPCETELIVVDDGSNDATPRILAARNGHPRLRILRHLYNRGKGAALITGASAAVGTHIVPFDADLEYLPDDLSTMMAPVLAGRTAIVYGTRLFGVNTVYQSYRSAMGNRALTFAANVLFDSYVSDIHTCLKLMPLDLFRALDLHEQGFGLDTEITAKLLQCGLRPFEVPISYHSRSYHAGKKITWHDGVECLRILGRVRFGGAKSQMRYPALARDNVAVLAPPPSSPSMQPDGHAVRTRSDDPPAAEVVARA